MTDAYAPPQSNLADHNNISLGTITDEMVSALRGTKGWVRLFGILMFIGAAFMVIGGIGMILGGSMMGAGGKGMPKGMLLGMGIMYFVMAAFYIFPATYLVKYASAIERLVSGGRTVDMESALEHQRKFWQFVGVLAVIMMVVMMVGIVAAIALPMYARMHG
ncbi:MAG TPA: DUF5362 family protein [Burkholderiaceae bacterium]|jgi:hypothetical protein